MYGDDVKLFQDELRLLGYRISDEAEPKLLGGRDEGGGAGLSAPAQPAVRQRGRRENHRVIQRSIGCVAKVI